MLKLSDLTLRSDVQLGPMLVSPSRRLVEGPGGHAHLEPLIMQVFLLLLDSGGKVVTRNELFDQCWGGVIVGDDSLNRAILKIRRTGGHVAPGLFEIETIPRTGYRLTGEILNHLHVNAQRDAVTEVGPFSRRALIGGSVAGLAIAGAGGFWLFSRRSNPRFDALMARGDEAFRNGSVQDSPSVNNSEPTAIYEEAVRLQPDSAKAWGILAYLRASTFRDGEEQKSDLRVSEAEYAISRALALDPKEPNALVGMLILKGPMLDWATRDRKLREVLAIDNRNFPAMYELGPLLQSAGLTRESWSWNERILELAPLSRTHLVMRAMKLWILGKDADSDRVIERVRGLWPTYGFAFGIRLMLLTLTDRPEAALAMINGATAESRGPTLDFWRVAAEALKARTPQAIASARAVCLEAARNTPWRVNVAVMTLCALGLVDDAFELTFGYLLSRGKAVSANPTDPRAVNDWNRRMTPWLFTPPAAVMRADPRFLQICDEFGLAAYWRARDVRPDYQVYV